MDVKPHLPLVRLFNLSKFARWAVVLIAQEHLAPPAGLWTVPLSHPVRLQDDGEQYTKLERMLVNTILSFRDKLSQPQPDLGLPALDPFDYTPDKPIQVANDFAK